MGMVTTMMIYHDNLDLLEESIDVTDSLYNVLCGGGDNTVTISGKYNTATLFKVKKTRHSSFTTLYMQTGNTLFEVSPYADEMLKIKETSPELFIEILEILEDNLKKLKQL